MLLVICIQIIYVNGIGNEAEERNLLNVEIVTRSITIRHIIHELEVLTIKLFIVASLIFMANLEHFAERIPPLLKRSIDGTNIFFFVRIELFSEIP